MSGVADGALVGIVIAASAGYAVYSLGPRALRRRLLTVAAAALQRLPAALGLRGLGLRLGAGTSAATGSCGGCDSCGAAAQGTPPADSAAAGVAAAGADGARAGGARPPEIRVPLSSIGRRR
jgi:hypothetical protein